MGLSLHAFHHDNCVGPSVCVCDYSLQGLLPQAYGEGVAYVTTLKKTSKMGLCLHALNHGSCVGLSVCDYSLQCFFRTGLWCVCRLCGHTSKTHPMGLCLHAFSP